MQLTQQIEQTKLGNVTEQTNQQEKTEPQSQSTQLDLTTEAKDDQLQPPLPPCQVKKKNLHFFSLQFSLENNQHINANPEKLREILRNGVPSSCMQCLTSMLDQKKRNKSKSKKKKKNKSSSPASATDSQQLWICVTCGNVACGRNDEKHSLAHCDKTKGKHCVVISLERGNHVCWCYGCDDYVVVDRENENFSSVIGQCLHVIENPSVYIPPIKKQNSQQTETQNGLEMANTNNENAGGKTNKAVDLSKARMEMCLGVDWDFVFATIKPVFHPSKMNSIPSKD